MYTNVKCYSIYSYIHMVLLKVVSGQAIWYQKYTSYDTKEVPLLRGFIHPERFTHLVPGTLKLTARLHIKKCYFAIGISFSKMVGYPGP